jgi:hypothetical protein
MDLEIMTLRPERQRDCAACQWTWLDEDEPGEHSCRTRPTPTRDAIQARRQAAHAVFAKRELAIREGRMAEITMSQVRRGRI